MLDSGLLRLSFLYALAITLSVFFIGYTIWFWAGRKKMKVRIIFEWFDFWAGLYYDQKKNILYFFPIPMLGIAINFGQRAKREVK